MKTFQEEGQTLNFRTGMLSSEWFKPCQRIQRKN